MPRAHAPCHTDRPLTLARALWLLVLALVLMGCPAHVVPGRLIVRELNLNGVRAVDASDLRERLAIRETPRFPTNRPRWLSWWRWWWTDYEYLDDNSLTRDRLRIRRYYQARGYYETEVSPPRVWVDGTERTDLGQRFRDGAQGRVDYSVTEGPLTRVADIRLRGCEPGDTLLLPEATCQSILERLSLRIGGPFDETSFTRDREVVLDFTRDAGFATPTVVPRAVVDPQERLAWVEYTIRPGPRSRFGTVRLFVLPGRTPYTASELPNGVPVRPVLSAIGIERGARYNRRVLAAAQQALFDLGVFGIARIEENPMADGTVDLNVTLSPARLWRLRLGVGAEINDALSNVHLLAGYEHRNALGGLRRFRVDLRPQIYFAAPNNWGNIVEQGANPGGTLTTELYWPEVLRRVAANITLGGELGPDPLNPARTNRLVGRVGVGLEYTPSRRITATAYLRGTAIEYIPCAFQAGCVSDLSANELLGQIFFARRYAYLDTSVVWDRRDNRIQPRRGFFLLGNLAASPGGVFSDDDYVFVRAQVEARAFAPLGPNFTFAARATFGALFGEGRTGWPAPPELRFYSGGSQSNRGYPPNRVGVLGVVPSNSRATGLNSDDLSTTNPLGGVAMWEASAELRWQPGKFGLVAFFDMSNVVGLDPARITDASVPSSALLRPLGTLDAFGQLIETRSTAGEALRSLHPSVGLGARYQTPVGAVRVDIGVRLADVDCNRAANDFRNPTARGYFLITQPRCDFLFWQDAVPLAFNFSLGEAY
jgi:outer membrane protein assembly factor BamA